MFQKSYAGQILGCHLQLLNAIRTGDYLPDRVTNLILQYLTNRFVVLRCEKFILSSVLSCKVIILVGSVSLPMLPVLDP